MVHGILGPAWPLHGARPAPVPVPAREEGGNSPLTERAAPTSLPSDLPRPGAPGQRSQPRICCRKHSCYRQAALSALKLLPLAYRHTKCLNVEEGLKCWPLTGRQRWLWLRFQWHLTGGKIRTVRVGRRLWRSSSPTPLPRQRHLEHLTQRGRLHDHPGQLFQCSATINVKFFLMLR